MRRILAIVWLMIGIIASGCGKDETAATSRKNETVLSGQTTPPAVTGTESRSPSPSNPAVRERFVLRDLDGRIRSWSEFAGKPLIINFWATWCGPCRYEMPIMKKLYDEYRSRGLQIVGISVDGPRTVRSVKPFVEQLGIPWVIVYADQNALREFDLGSSIPVTIFFDAVGNETGRFTGANREEVFRAEIQKMF